MPLGDPFGYVDPFGTRLDGNQQRRQTIAELLGPPVPQTIAPGEPPPGSFRDPDPFGAPDPFRPTLGRQGGSTTLQEHGNVRVLQPGEEESAQNYVLDFLRTGQRHVPLGPSFTGRGPGASLTPQPFTGFSPNLPFEGFNFGREQRPGESAKDAFALIANQAGAPPPFEDKGALTAWFDQHIRPNMEALGYQINWVEGDKFNMTGPQGTGTIDWVRGAGAPGAAFAWQVVEDDPAATGRRVGGGDGGLVVDGGGEGDTGTVQVDVPPLEPSALGLDYPGLLPDIQAAIRALANPDQLRRELMRRVVSAR